MKLFYSVVLYMFISGIALSGIIKVSSDRCGPVAITSEDILLSTTWPMMISLSIMVDLDNLKPTVCEGEADVSN